MAEQERPPYWLPVQHSMTRRSDHNNYHTAHKAYMVTLKIEEMAPLLSQVIPTAAALPPTPKAAAVTATEAAAVTATTETAQELAALFDATRRIEESRRIAECRLTPLGEAMRRAWLTLPQRFPNITVIDSPEEYVIMPEHFHGIIYVMAYMEEHLSDIVKLFKARVAMAYRHLLLEAAAPAAAPAASTALAATAAAPAAPAASTTRAATAPTTAAPTASAISAATPAAAAKGALRPVGLAKEWLRAYKALPAEQQAATRRWVEGQLELLFSATRRRKEEQRRLQQAIGPSPIRVAATGGHNETGFLFATGYTDSMLLDDDNLLGHRAYIFNNPHSRWQRTSAPSRLRANRAPIFTAVTISALEGYLRRECPPSDVTAPKLAAVRDLLLTAEAPTAPTAAPTAATTAPQQQALQQPQGALQQPQGALLQAQQPQGVAPQQPLCSATRRRKEIICHSYGDRALLERRLLPVVCHRKDLPLFSHQKARCLAAAAAGAVLISAGISRREREIIEAAMAAGHPVIRIEDNGFPDIYHPSQARIDLCDASRLLILTPWQYHYRHKEDAIFVAYCKTMNCIAQALARQKDSWWKAP